MDADIINKCMEIIESKESVEKDYISDALGVSSTKLEEMLLQLDREGKVKYNTTTEMVQLKKRI